MDNATFQEIVWQNYHNMNRQLPWREPEADERYDAYKILVSEVMLQQTQAKRVIPKYQQFIEQFPDAETLARTELATVLTAWSGLGYNRRAKYLHEAVKKLSPKPQPWTYEDLVACKGIGPNTAAAVCVYAYNEPRVFIETNIRTVFIHHFFSDQEGIHDKELLPFLERALDGVRVKQQPEQEAHFSPALVRKAAGSYHYGPREWYWALMDYGVYIKSTAGNASRSSKQYVKQSKFEGSNRQIRGHVLRLLAGGSLSFGELSESVGDPRLPDVLAALQKEGLITRQAGRYVLG